MDSEQAVSSNLGGGIFQEATQFQPGAIPHCVYADDSGTSLCGK